MTTNLPDRDELPGCFTRLMDKVLIKNIVTQIDFQNRLQDSVSDAFGQDFQECVEGKELFIRGQRLLHSDGIQSDTVWLFACSLQNMRIISLPAVFPNL